MDAPEFSMLLRDAQKHEIVIDDEAADISSRSALNKQNKLFMIVYQLIRGENLFSILIIPSIFDLDPFFRKRRVRHLIHILTRGKYHFWDKQSLRKMVEINEGRPFKNYYVVRPTARGKFSDYKGIYLEPYLEKKKDKMKRVREMLVNELTKDETNSNGDEKDAIDKELARITATETFLKDKKREIELGLNI